MPAWTKADFDLEYNAPILIQRDANTWDVVPLQGHYCRAARMPYLGITVPQWIEDIGITATDSVALMGGAFGFSHEVAEEYFGQAVDWVVVDTSQYVQDTKDLSEEAEIRGLCQAQGKTQAQEDAIVAQIVDGQPKARKPVLDQSLANQGSIRAVLNAISKANPDFVITEEMLQTMTDQEIASYGPHLDDLVTTGRVVHLTEVLRDGETAPPQRGTLRWMTGAEWRTILNAAGLSHHEIYCITTREFV